MDCNVKESTMNLLADYGAYQRQIALLKFEREHLPQVLPQDMIDEMNYKRTDYPPQADGKPALDKTMKIATNYVAQASREQEKIVAEITKRLQILEDRMERLHRYVSLLSPREQQVIVLFYFEKKTIPQITAAMDISRRSAFALKKTALANLIEMYVFSKNIFTFS